MVAFIAARNVLKARLEAVFDEVTFAGLYEDVQHPVVYQGFPVNEQPFYVAVDEIVDTAEASAAATMGHARIDFTIHVWVFAQHVKQETASNILLSYIDAIFKAVLADQQLNNTVDNAFPSIAAAGTSADSSRYYIASAAIDIQCSIFSQCPSKLMGVVNESNNWLQSLN